MLPAGCVVLRERRGIVLVIGNFRLNTSGSDEMSSCYTCLDDGFWNIGEVMKT